MIAVSDPRIPAQWHVFRNVEYEKRQIYKKRWIIMKKTGKVSGALTSGGIGLWGIAKEIAQGEVIRHGKRAAGGVIITVATYICPFGVGLVTNSTKILKVAKGVHSFAAATIRCCENVADMPYVVVDIILFGELCPTCESNSYNLMSNSSDTFINFLD